MRGHLPGLVLSVVLVVAFSGAAAAGPPAQAKPGQRVSGQEASPWTLGLHGAWVKPMKDWADVSDMGLGGFIFLGHRLNPLIMLTARGGYLRGPSKDAFGFSIITSQTFALAGARAYLGDKLYLSADGGWVQAFISYSGSDVTEDNFGFSGGAGLDLGTLDVGGQLFFINANEADRLMGFLLSAGYHVGF